jgi:hypothetical protein
MTRLLTLLLLALPFPAAAKSDGWDFEPNLNCASLAKYHRIEHGMVYIDAILILSCPGEEVASTSVGGFNTVIVRFESERPNHNGHMNLTFQNGRVVGKAQVGLR